MQRDKILAFRDVARFQFVSSNPTCYVDPFGTDEKPATKPAAPGPVPDQDSTKTIDLPHVTVTYTEHVTKIVGDPSPLAKERGLTVSSAGFGLDGKCVAFCGKWLPDLSYKFSVDLSVLAKDDPAFDKRLQQYRTRREGLEWSRDLERRMTYSHERDHARTWIEGFAKAVSKFLEDEDSKVYDTEKECKDATRKARLAFLDILGKAQRHTLLFDLDANGIDQGDQYDSHPLVIK
jgi:hypothetical protein